MTAIASKIAAEKSFCVRVLVNWSSIDWSMLGGSKPAGVDLTFASALPVDALLRSLQQQVNVFRNAHFFPMAIGGVQNVSSVLRIIRENE